MLKKLGKILTNNFGLKILAILFAMILWLVVVNIDDPTRTKPFTTNVTLENSDYITGTLEKYYEVTNDSTTVTFSVSAKRSILEKLSSTAFSASADMERIEYNDKAKTYQIPITISVNGYSASQVAVVSRTQYVTVDLEELTTKKVMITANTEGEVADGCAIGDVSIDTTNVVNVSGPKSIVSKINSAVATINVDGMTDDITDNVIPVLYDADGNVIDTTKLKLSIDVVTVTAKILGTKEVELAVDTMGEPADGYEVTGTEFSPGTVKIKGTASVLNAVTKIEIPVEVLDISGATSDFVKEIDVTSYLPDGVSLVDKSENKVTVTVHVEEVVTKDFDVPVSNLSITNVASNYNAAFEVETVKITVSGLASDMNRLNVANISGTVDVSGLGKGVHMAQVSWNLDDSIYSVKTNVTASVSLTEKQEADSETTDNTDNTENGTNTSGTGSSGSGNGTSGTGTAGSGTTGSETNGNGTSGNTGGTSSGTTGSSSSSKAGDESGT
ncbi:MAG: CdaR family protein [Roseburia sp.]|uniref:CdaR family protein n=1 Tax=Roseburia sp. 831b TaxID=1261635 RepID=UPI0009518430|nr:CdaR family protein [Roseburia sp. 831b]MCI5920217.1 CdaR family protein [Roseburia sp.]MDY5882593.1 CdaR family protein [Roseburia sp.]WVK72024.1 CdaR family protein [Roseburia sp. 831b]